MSTGIMYIKNKFSPPIYLGAFILSAIAFIGCSEDNLESIGANFQRDVEILASDEFEGRAPASPGGLKAKNYIEMRFKEIGLKPGNADSYFQTVPLLETESSDFSSLKISGSDFNLSFNYLDDMVIGSYQLNKEITIENSEIVFAGYGIVAPEYNWNDYEGLDVKGKTVVVLVNDPGFSTEDNSLFNGRAMTYYGRWTYKFEEAARQGAAAALIIHQTEPASYGWEVVRNSWSGKQYSVVVNGNTGRLPAEGWIQYDAAEKLFREAGVNLNEAIAEAAQKEFSARSINATASISFKNSFSQSECHNVIGYIEGSEYPEEIIIYMAHWDHLGMVQGNQGLEIYNGAVDNATGVAALFSISEAFLSDEKVPNRSVLFIAVTAEESGLLGSKYYAENPLFPIANTVGGINMDALNVYGPTHDVVSIGYGFSELDNLLEKHASAQKRVVKPDPNPERGYYYRSDHFNLARHGVPMIYAKGGTDYIGRDESYLKMVQEDYAGRYHTPNDVIHDLWNYEGIYQDLLLFYNIGKDLSNSNSFPNWNEGNEFRAIRDSTAQERRR
jgi:Zn-dependent M28 family amino/carboxypeptidase